MKDKDIKLSNVKGFLILLVVFGHTIEPGKDNYLELYTFIYSFHMPLFILVSGYFSKRMTGKKILNFLLLYIIFQTIFLVYELMIGRMDGFNFDYFKPVYHLWYLLSMIYWYVITYIISKFNLTYKGKGILLIIIFLVGFMSRFVMDDIYQFLEIFGLDFSGYSFSIQRTLTFMPFFFLGLFLNKESLHRIYHSMKQYFSVFSFAIITFIVFVATNYADSLSDYFKGSKSMESIFEDSVNYFEFFNVSIFQYVVAFILCYIILNFISSNTGLLTHWGDNSLPVFLLHPIVALLLKELSFYESWSPLVQLSAAVISTLLIVQILSRDRVVRYLNIIMRPLNTIQSIYIKNK